MKIKIIFSLLIILLFWTFQSYADSKWKNNGNKVNYSWSPKQTWVAQTCWMWDSYEYDCWYYTPAPYYTETYCPAGEVLIETQRNKNPLGSAGQLTCMIIDEIAPVISVNFNGYINDTWTNKNVKLNIAVTDVWLWIKKVWYTINWTTYTWSTGFELNFNEEGVYNIVLWAEDNSTHNWSDGSSSSEWNKVNVIYVVKIDKSAPILDNIPDINYNWRNTKPILSFNIADKYKWQSIEVKTFMCTGKPANSYWTGTISPSWELVWTCNPVIANCTVDSNFSPNLSSCSWSCLAWYTKWSDNLCHENTKTLTCDNTLLPQGFYWYDINNDLTYLSWSLKSIWNLPTWVSVDGNFLATYNWTVNSYSPNTSSCGYTCSAWLHVEDYKCVNNNSIICCQKSYPLSHVKSIWVVVDCSIVANQNHVSCQYNELCWGYVKDVLKYWTGTQYDYESEWVIWINTLPEACWMENIPNSNGITCNPWYYLVWEGTATQTCERVPMWEWSGQENTKKACTNKPNNSTYTLHTASTWWSNDCPWVCWSDYSKSWNNCVNQSKTSSCNAKPSNTSWNSVSSITQYKNSGNWEPSLTPTYNSAASTSECRFKCSTWYDWNGSSCVLPPPSVSCVNDGVLFYYNGSDEYSILSPGTYASWFNAPYDSNGWCNCNNWNWEAYWYTRSACSTSQPAIINGTQTISSGGDGDWYVTFNANGTINVSNFCWWSPGVCAWPWVDSILNWWSNLTWNYYINFQCSSTTRCSASWDTGWAYIPIGWAGVSAINVRYNSSASCSCTYRISNTSSSAGATFWNGTINFDVWAWNW